MKVVSMSTIPIGVQLFSVRRECANDLEATLDAIAAMGYRGVEFAGYYGHSADRIRAMLDEAGLDVAGSHVQLNTLLGDALEETVAFNKKLDNRFLIVPSMPDEYRGGVDRWKANADLFNEISLRLESYDMVLGYHNHSFEWVDINGNVPWDIFFSRTRPGIIMQADSGNALRAGGDISEYIEKYPGRALSVHLKEYSPEQKGACIGEGIVDWQKIFTVCETVGSTQWYIVEQGSSHDCSAIEAIQRCLETLKKWGK
jgi:sugar phosphate isomerase/epimerase